MVTGLDSFKDSDGLSKAAEIRDAGARARDNFRSLGVAQLRALGEEPDFEPVISDSVKEILAAGGRMGEIIDLSTDNNGVDPDEREVA